MPRSRLRRRKHPLLRPLRPLLLSLLAAPLALTSATDSWAQGASAHPTGTFTPGHLLRATTPTGSPYMDAGGSTPGSTTNYRGASELGLTNTGTPFCISDAATNAPGGYHQLCFGANALGGALMSYSANGGATQLPLSFNINGVNYPFPFVVGGIVGPGSTTAGNVACWNNTVGTLLKDCSNIRRSIKDLAVASTLYVNTSTGSDGNDCQAATVSGGHGPCATLQRAVDVGFALDLSNTVLLINLTGSTTAGAVLAGHLSGAGSGAFGGSLIRINGQSAASTTIDDQTANCGTLIVDGSVELMYDHVTLKKTTGCGSGGAVVFIQRGAIAEQGSADVNYSTTDGDHIHIEAGGKFESAYGYTISANANSHIANSNGGLYEMDPNGNTITLLNTPHFATAFASGVAGAIIEMPSNTVFSGSATGQRLSLSGNSILNTLGAVSSTFLPGDSGSAVVSGSIIQPPYSSNPASLNFLTAPLSVQTIGSNSNSTLLFTDQSTIAQTYRMPTYNNGSTTYSHLVLGHAHGTFATPTEPANGDQLGRFGWYDPTNGSEVGAIAAQATENWIAGTNYGHTITLSAVPVGSASPVTALIVGGSQGQWSVPVQLATYTVGTLPGCGAGLKGALAYVSDQSGAPSYRGALTGGAALAVPVFCNGSAWEAH